MLGRFAVLGFILSCLTASPALACDIAVPRALARDPSETIPGWMVYAFTPAAPVSGHVLHRRIEQTKPPQRRALARLIERQVRASIGRLYRRSVTAVKIELLEGKILSRRRPADYAAKANAFVLILGFGPDSVRASGYLRENARAGNLSILFAITHPDDVNKVFPIVEQFASHPGHDCAAGDSP